MKILVIIAALFTFSACAQKIKPVENLPTEPLVNQNKCRDENYVQWFKKNSLKLIKDSSELLILKPYMNFICRGNTNDLEKTTQALIQKTQQKNKRVSSPWISFFEGHYKLIHKDASLGTMTRKYWLPLLESGDQRSIDLFLVYSAAVESSGSDRSNIDEIASWLQNKYPQQINKCTQKYSRFFNQFPPIIL